MSAGDPELGAALAEASAARLQRAGAEDVVARVWSRDESLWGGPGPEIGDRLGWLDIADRLRGEAGDLAEFAAAVAADGLTDAVLLGMGGSSLGPEVLRRSFGDSGGLRLHVLDSTDPGAVRALETSVDLARTAFVVSSKSGGTIETLSHMRYFHDRVTASGGSGAQFVAVTDPGSGLVAEAQRRGFRRVFENDPDIGGRYSVLSYFGLVPAALAGIDVGALLDSAIAAGERCRAGTGNPGLALGCAIGEAALGGRDKLTFVVDEPLSSFGLWVEQLIAESTGKHGKGILPVADEPLGGPGAYGPDRVVVHISATASADTANADAVAALEAAGTPVVRLGFSRPADLGEQFFLWEFATAVAGWVLEINPFDQPNVQAAKDKTAEVLGADAPPEVDPGDAAALIAAAAPPSYVAILGYVAPSEHFDAEMAELRAAIRDVTGVTTTFGYGPRYLHSTGQLHKGGAADGVFIEVFGGGGEDVAVPEAGFSFGELIAAQATGDLLTLRERGLPAARIRPEDVGQLIDKVRN